MRRKNTYKQLLAIAVVSATFGSGTAWGETVQPIINPTLPKPPASETQQQPLSPDAQAIAAARGADMPVVKPGSENPSVIVDTSGLATQDKSVKTITNNEGATTTNKAVTTEVAPVEAQYVSAFKDADLAPYAGKVITNINFEPIDAAHQSLYAGLIKNRIGDQISAEGVKADIVALGNTGVFSEVNPILTVVPEGVKLTYKLTLNPVVQGVSFTGNTVYTNDALTKYMEIQPGTVLNSIHVGQKVQGINAAYNRDGYILAHVTGINVDNAGNLNVNIVEGTVEKIIVQGNKKTKDYVIIREMNQKVGKPFNKFLVRRSIEKVYNTGYFEDVNVRLLPGSDPTKVIIEVDVLEQKTGTLTVGAGYSKADGLVGIVEVGENNFRGTGDKVKVHWEFGGAGGYKNYQLSYTRPWIDDKGTSLGFSIFNRTDRYTDYNSEGNSVAEYDKKSNGFNISLGRQTGEYTRDYVTLETRRDSYEKWKDGFQYAADPFFTNFDYIGKNFGRTNSITWQKVYDSRDNVYDPTRGKRLSLTTQWAGHGLGGDFDFYKITAEARAYKKVGHAQVLAARARIGWAQGNVPYSQLYTAGGADTLRGYEDDQFRGKKTYNAMLEYRFPLVKKVTGVVFTDIGDAWDAPDVNWYKSEHKLNASIGTGVRVNTPIGPVRLDYGWGTNGGKFHFSFGGQF